MWWNRGKEIQGELKHLNDRLDEIVELICMKDDSLTIKTMDKFEDYMKNVDKLNSLVNEFKGCVALARAEIAERKQRD
jgi:peptidoglycan hydrolase CwlO-like protein